MARTFSHELNRLSFYYSPLIKSFNCMFWGTTVSMVEKGKRTSSHTHRTKFRSQLIYAKVISSLKLLQFHSGTSRISHDEVNSFIHRTLQRIFNKCEISIAEMRLFDLFSFAIQYLILKARAIENYRAI